MKIGRSKPEKVDKPKPTGFTTEQKKKQQSLNDRVKINRWLNEDGELK